MSFTLEGTVIVIADEQKVSEKFRKRDFVIKTEAEQYPQTIQFQLTQERCSLLNDAVEGQQLRVHFNLRGRPWQSPQGDTKYFNTLEAWKIEPVGEKIKRTPQQESDLRKKREQEFHAQANPNNGITTFTSSNELDDLPF